MSKMRKITFLRECVHEQVRKGWVGYANRFIKAF